MPESDEEAGLGSSSSSPDDTSSSASSDGASSDEDAASTGSDSEAAPEEGVPAPGCPDCGEPFAEATGGILTCKCGLQKPVPAVTPPVRSPRSRNAAGKKKAKTPPKTTKSQKFLAEVSGRLSAGVPNFVLKDAHQLYGKALKSEERKGCSDVGEAARPAPAAAKPLRARPPSADHAMPVPRTGLALAALEHGLRKHKLEPPRPELCTAALNKVNLTQLEACSEVLRKVTNDRFPDQTPSAAHFATKLCEDLLEPQKMRERGLWAKAAEAVANQALELRAGVDSPPLCLAAAICILVFERHTPKGGEIKAESVAKAAGQDESLVMDCYTCELLPHVKELLDASQVAILPQASARLDAPAPHERHLRSPVTAAKTSTRKRKPATATPPSTPGSGGGGGSAGGSGGAPAGASPGADVAAAATAASGSSSSDAGADQPAASASTEEGPDAASSTADAAIPAQEAHLCKHCSVQLPPHEAQAELCVDCRDDQCQLCGSVDPIAVDQYRRCFGCMREAVLRSRLRAGALRGFTAVPIGSVFSPVLRPAPAAMRSPSPRPLLSGVPQQRATPELPLLPVPMLLTLPPPAAAAAAADSDVSMAAAEETAPAAAGSEAAAAADSTSSTPLRMTVVVPPLPTHPLNNPPAPVPPPLPPASPAHGSGSEWERPGLTEEVMQKLLSSPMRPATPSRDNSGYPQPSPPHFGVSPRASPRHVSGAQGLQPALPGPLPGPLLVLPPASPHRSAHDAAQPVHGEHRAKAEWTRATARHASPYIGLTPSSPYVGNRMASPSPYNASGEGPVLDGSDRPTRIVRSSSNDIGLSPLTAVHTDGAGLMPPPQEAPAVTRGGSGGGGDELPYWQTRRSPARPATDPRSSPCWSAAGSFPSFGLGLERPATDPRRSPLVTGVDRPSTDPRRSPFVGSVSRQSPRHAPGAMLPPPPRAKASTKDDAPMTDDDMNSWLLDGPSSTGGWQYGSHLAAEAPLQTILGASQPGEVPPDAGARVENPAPASSRASEKHPEEAASEADAASPPEGAPPAAAPAPAAQVA